ncbi:MAG: hypothetical protein Q8P46_12590 [Hyphomicrobiales bacterium]|nr:hypothetical protein [Hyphomicrobiales bacterium]
MNIDTIKAFLTGPVCTGFLARLVMKLAIAAGAVGYAADDANKAALAVMTIVAFGIELWQSHQNQKRALATPVPTQEG